MIKGLDSSSAPNASQVAQAKAAGYSLWSGYLQTKPNVNIYHAWTQPNFETARQCGSTPIAYCSGWDDPVACKNLAAQWNVRLCLDVESSVRSDGPWVQAWLDASGAGLYGNLPVFNGRHAPFFVMSAYPGHDFGTTWSGPPPPVPHAWQWWGSHSLFGIGVDTTNFDDWFGQSPQPQEDDDMASLLGVTKGPNGEDPGVWLLSGSMYVHVDDPATLAGFNAAGIKGGTIDYGQHLILAANSTTSLLDAIQKLFATTPAVGPVKVAGTLQVTS